MPAWVPRLTALVALAVPSTALSAQETSNAIVGVVVARETGERLAHSVIAVPSLGLRRFADDSGAFVLRNLPAGSFVVHARRLGFAPRDLMLTVQPGAHDSLRIELTRVAVKLAAVQVLADPPAYYCGIPQGRDPGELGARGCYVVDVDEARRVTARFVATDVVRWQPIDVDIGTLADDEALRRACREAVAGALDEADGRTLVVRLRLVGRGALHPTVRRAGYLDDLRLLLDEERSQTAPFAWVESIRDATRPEVDLDARRDAPDFVGDFLRTVAAARRGERTTDPEEHERWMATLRGAVAPLFDESQRGRRLLRDVRPEDADLTTELLDEAEALGIELLLVAEEDR